MFYNKNWQVLDADGVPAATRFELTRPYAKTSTVLSPSGSGSSRVIESPIIEQVDAENFVTQTAARDGARNERYEFRMVGTNNNFFVGAVGTIRHPLMPRRGVAEIRSISTNTLTRETNLLVVFYE